MALQSQNNLVPAYGQAIMPEREAHSPTEQVQSSLAFSAILSAMGMPSMISHMLEAGHSIHSGLEAGEDGQMQAPSSNIDPKGAMMPDEEFLPAPSRNRLS